ncbi:MAG: ArsR/SmtB family transcription factor [Acidimicrobiales bacterium]
MGEDGNPRRGPCHGARDGLPPLRCEGDPLSARPRGLRELDELEAVFGALANGHRRHILVTLHARGGAMTAGELADRFSHSWSTTTRHLQRLEAAGLVRVEKAGRERRYTLDADHLRRTTSTFLEVFGDG